MFLPKDFTPLSDLYVVFYRNPEDMKESQLFKKITIKQIKRKVE